MKRLKGILVAIDSQVLVWGIRAQGSEEQRRRAKWLFQNLEDQEAQVIVPAIAVSEYLVPAKLEEHSGIIASLAERFILAPFDVRCASLAAQLFTRGKEVRPMNIDNARKLLKADAMIIATSAVHGAKILYSGDVDCRKVAELAPRLKVEDLPNTAPDLFEDASLRNPTKG